MADGDIILSGCGTTMSAYRVAAEFRRGELGAHGLWSRLGCGGGRHHPFEDIAPNPWGPMLEVRQTPVPGDRDEYRHLA